MLKIESLSKTFHAHTVNEVRALQNVNLTVANGSFTAIIGTNGSGKSTLLNAVAGTFEPDAGRIFLDGQEISRWSEYRRAAYIGRVFQNPFAGTVAEMT
ncbi:MAG TPA: ATP-binding cassette domain-containing protein, partial [Candidatus Marinimicrobia bacterium]|nr:ATP-binding cassette domain-containing protein [Candidatus Neomarinimicrobiota bacterium]